MRHPNFHTTRDTTTGSLTTEQRQCAICLQADKLLVFKDASVSSESPPLFP
jgi:hypothetical protein